MSIKAEFFRQYRDRGLLKYQGFFLSEHTATLSSDHTTRHTSIKALPQLTEQELQDVIEEALLKDRAVFIQLDETDLEGNFRPNVTGKLIGYDDVALYVGTTAIPYDTVRLIGL
ncbi:hypothetical protein [Enterococcus sp. LJL90]